MFKNKLKVHLKRSIYYTFETHLFIITKKGTDLMNSFSQSIKIDHKKNWGRKMI